MAWSSKGVLGLLVFVTSLQQCLCADPCTSYHTLKHDKRVLSYKSTTSETEECDRYLPFGTNWYRIDGNSGSDLLSYCPDVGQCGTLFPIWLNGSIPRKSEGIVTRTACKRGLLDEACCEAQINIKLKNCGLFRIAYLHALQGCPGKYCFEYKELCPPGQSSESGFMPCTSSFAHVSSSAKAQVVPFTNSTEATRPNDLRLFFHCNRLYDGSRSSYFFDVNWYIDGKLVKTISKVPYSRYNTDTALGEDNTWRLPMMVNCSYRARSFKSGVPSPPVMSDEFFAGIKVSPEVAIQIKERTAGLSYLSRNITYHMMQIVLKVSPEGVMQVNEDSVSPEGVIQVNEGSTGAVYFQSTIPVPCITKLHGHPYVPSCDINFENNVNETHGGCSFTGRSRPNIRLDHDCGFIFKGDRWSSRQSMSIRATSDGTTGNPRSPALIRLSSTSGGTFPLWSNYKLPEIKVITKDRNRVTMNKKCGAWTDVQIDTFDGLTIHTNNVGWYLLYKHTEKPIEIMTITEPGRGYGTVNCAVSVKAGEDIYMAYLCQNKYIIKRLGCEHGNNLEVYDRQQAKKTLIILPTGTKVEIQFHPFYKDHSWVYLQIYIYPSPEDYAKVTGLCGNLNGARDETSSLAQRHRLGDVVNSDEFVKAVSGSFPVNRLICLCPKYIKTITTLNNIVSCDWRTGVSCTRMQWNVKPCLNRQKRDAHLDEEDWASQDIEYKTKTKRVVRSTWTLPAARDKCLKVFEQYRSFNKCREVTGVDVGSVLDGCATDVVKSGDVDWIPAALEVIKSQCINILDVDLDLWKPTSPGAVPKGKVIFTEAKCPSECSDNGHCVAGVCHCNPDFVEEDCSVNLKRPPVVDRLTRNGVCDLGNPNTSCSATHVFGMNFYESNRLTCRVKEFLIDETGVKVDSTTTEQQAVFETFRQILCTFPDTKTFSIPHDGIGVHGYHVEVSNNGKIYSTSLTFVASDQRCHQCDLKNMTCSKKADSCLIESNCYTSGEAKPSEPHMKCTPTVSGFKWTQEIVKSQAVRLVDGHSNLEGRVELLHNGQWGTICSFAFDDIDATVICKMLGYDDTPGKAKALKNFGGGSGPIWFDDPECKGTEADIADCPRMFKTSVPIWGTNNCQHSEDVGVRCVSRLDKPMIIG